MTKKEKAEMKENVVATNATLASLGFWLDQIPESEEKDCLVEAFHDFCAAYRRIKDKGLL